MDEFAPDVQNITGETEPEPAPAAEPGSGPAFEDLTLGEALLLLVLRPIAAARQWWRVLIATAGPEQAVEPGQRTAWPDLPRVQAAADRHPQQVFAALWTRWGAIGVQLVAILLALQGGSALHSAVSDPFKQAAFDTGGAGRWFVLAGVLFAAGSLAESRTWWAGRFPQAALGLRWLRQRADPRGRWIAGLLAAAGAAVIAVLAGVGGLLGGALLLGLAALIWLGVLIASTEAPVAVAHAPDAAMRAIPARPRADLDWINAHAVQIALLLLAGVFALLGYTRNVLLDGTGRVSDVVITADGAVFWLLSVVAAIVALGADLRRVPQRMRALLASQPDWSGWAGRVVARVDWPLLVLIGAMIGGAGLRLWRLGDVPPEMTSDHIEKLLDALKVHDGYYAVFFPNNGGREAFQMYLVALIGGTLGVGFNFTALKLATVLEGVLTLPAVWWMAQQVIGDRTPEERQIGRWVGAALAGLLAISAWHLMLSRLGLRIVLTPLTTALVIGLLARALRDNRLRDYLALGAVLGAGVYFYQANRMLPVIVVVAGALAILGALRRWSELGGLILAGGAALVPLLFGAVVGEGAGVLPVLLMVWWAVIALWAREADRGPALRHAGGLLAAGAVALAVLVPMLHYSSLEPGEFWNRTRGRLYGENAFVRLNANGVLMAYEPSFHEQFERFWEQRDVFVDNYRDALRMYHWEGDAAWINNAGNAPALDGATGGLLILGLVVGSVWILRRGDAMLLLLPLSVLVMLLPTALTLAYTIENPSFTRASGTIPAVFMLAALPLGLLLHRLSALPWRVVGVRIGAVAGGAILAGLLVQASGWDRQHFFTDYRAIYSASWKPYREIAKPLRTFAQGEGSYGNAFMVAYPHWLDHRILGAMAGDIRWPNGLVERDDLLGTVRLNAGTAYAYDPQKPLFVMFHPDDAETAAYLMALVPGGEIRTYRYTWETAPGLLSMGEFMIFSARAGNLLDG